MTDLEKPLGCPQCGLLGGHARGCSEVLSATHLSEAERAERVAEVRQRFPFEAHPAATVPATRPKLRALSTHEELPAIADQSIVDRVMSTLIAEDARARSCLPPSPNGYHWEAALETRPNGTAALGEVRVRISYRLTQDS